MPLPGNFQKPVLAGSAFLITLAWPAHCPHIVRISRASRLPTTCKSVLSKTFRTELSYCILVPAGDCGAVTHVNAVSGVREKIVEPPLPRRLLLESCNAHRYSSASTGHFGCQSRVQCGCPSGLFNSLQFGAVVSSSYAIGFSLIKRGRLCQQNFPYH